MYMTQPDRQRIQHIRNYCEEIRKTIERYGDGFAAFDQDADYQRSIASVSYTHLTLPTT